MLKDDTDFFRMIYHFFADGTKLTYAAMGVGVLIAILYFRIFFRGMSGFREDVENVSKDTMFDPDYVDRQWSYDKILIWLGLSIGCGVLAYYQLPEWFPHLFKAP